MARPPSGMELVAGVCQGQTGILEVGLGDEDQVGVEGGKGEDGNAGGRQAGGDGGQDAGEMKGERTSHFENAKTVLAGAGGRREGDEVLREKEGPGRRIAEEGEDGRGEVRREGGRVRIAQAGPGAGPEGEGGHGREAGEGNGARGGKMRQFAGRDGGTQMEIGLDGDDGPVWFAGMQDAFRLELEGLIRSLFPPDCGVGVLPCEGAGGSGGTAQQGGGGPGAAGAGEEAFGEDWVHAEERVQSAGYAEGRRQEFRVGRAAARRAAAALGADWTGQPIRVDGDRAPVWPEGWLGTLSHGGGWAAAVVARETAGWRGLGLDLEQRERCEDKLWRLILRPEERAWVEAGTGEDTPVARATLIFAAKEALFKAVFPRSREWFGFLDATSRAGADPEPGRPGWLSLVLPEKALPGVPAGWEWVARYGRVGNLVAVGVTW